MGLLVGRLEGLGLEGRRYDLDFQAAGWPACVGRNFGPADLKCGVGALQLLATTTKQGIAGRPTRWTRHGLCLATAISRSLLGQFRRLVFDKWSDMGRGAQELYQRRSRALWLRRGSSGKEGSEMHSP